MDKQVHLSWRQSGARGGEAKGRKRGLAGVRRAEQQAGWGLAARPVCGGLQNVQNVPPRRPCAPRPRSSFTPGPRRFLALTAATPETFLHTLLSALPTHAHTAEALRAFGAPSASWARSGFLQCHGGRGGEQGQSCRASLLATWESMPLASAAGHGQRWTLGHRDRWTGSEPAQGHCRKPHPQLQQRGDSPKACCSHSLQSGKHWKSITRLEGGTRLILI